MPGKILTCIHRKNSDSALVGRALLARGFRLDIRCSSYEDVLGDVMPNLKNYHGIVIFGGPQSANDETEAMRAEHHLVEKALHDGLPLLGICLGAQIMARVLGGAVRAHREGRVEAGFYKIKPSHAACDIFPHQLMAYQWHREGIMLPQNVQLLAEGSGAFPVQAFCDGHRAYGLQFHPEVDFAMIRRWLKRDRYEDRRLCYPGAQPSWRHLAGYIRHHRAIKGWLSRFLDIWLQTKEKGL